MLLDIDIIAMFSPRISSKMNKKKFVWKQLQISNNLNQWYKHADYHTRNIPVFTQR